MKRHLKLTTKNIIKVEKEFIILKDVLKKARISYATFFKYYKFRNNFASKELLYILPPLPLKFRIGRYTYIKEKDINKIKKFKKFVKANKGLFSEMEKSKRSDRNVKTSNFFIKIIKDR